MIDAIAKTMADQRGRLPINVSERREIAEAALAIIRRRVGSDPDVIRQVAFEMTILTLADDEDGTRDMMRANTMRFPFSDTADD